VGGAETAPDPATAGGTGSSQLLGLSRGCVGHLGCIVAVVVVSGLTQLGLSSTARSPAWGATVGPLGLPHRVIEPGRQMVDACYCLLSVAAAPSIVIGVVSTAARRCSPNSAPAVTHSTRARAWGDPGLRDRAGVEVNGEVG
jgi:hypothetical protein